MATESRETLISGAFVAVADTLTSDFDVVDLLFTLVERCTFILDTDAGGLMLASGSGRLELMTSTSESADFVEVMQLNADSGPCIDSFKTGLVVSVPDIAASTRWPAFRAVALENGFNSAHAIPLKLRGQVIGTMNLFASRTGELNARDAAVGQALADVATIGILHERIARESSVLAEQLHRALDTRILIEQAKGQVAHSLTIKIEESFDLIRAYARTNGMTIRDVAEGIVVRRISPQALTSASAAKKRNQTNAKKSTPPKG